MEVLKVHIRADSAFLVPKCNIMLFICLFAYYHLYLYLSTALLVLIFAVYLIHASGIACSFVGLLFIVHPLLIKGGPDVDRRQTYFVCMVVISTAFILLIFL